MGGCDGGIHRSHFLLGGGFISGDRQKRWTRAWCCGLLLALVVKVAGLTVAGPLSLLGLLLLSGWLPWLAEVSGARYWRWRQRGLIWALVNLTALIWLPLGWCGYLATLQVSLRLPAAFQNALFMSRYQWLPVVSVLWLGLWGYSLKWLPALWQQLHRPTSWRGYWRQGWQTAWWPVVRRFIRYSWVVVAAVILASGWLAVTWLVESWWPAAGFGMLIIAMTGLQVATWCALSWCWHRGWPQLPRTSIWGRVVLLIAAISFAGWWGRPGPGHVAAVIAHRGVNGNDGVQNTTSALKQTVRTTAPAMVEMDIQPTADNHWVVMHDPNLQALAGRSGAVADYRLNQLSGLSLRENGRRGQLSPFSDYATVAKRLRQPLLIEIKAVANAEQLTGAFIARYGHQIRQRGSAVHSLDYRIIMAAKRRDARVRVGFVTPFYLTDFSHSVADFYSLQGLTASREQVNAAHRAGKPVYFWTVDRLVDQQRLTVLGADGLITNRSGQVPAISSHYYFYQLLNWCLAWL